MEKKLTLWQRIAYAHWVAKQNIIFAGKGPLFISAVAIVYLGLILWFFESEIKAIDFSGEHAFSKKYLAIILSMIVLIIASYVTVYIPHFIRAFFDNDEIYRRHFLKYYYHKH